MCCVLTTRPVRCPISSHNFISFNNTSNILRYIYEKHPHNNRKCGRTRCVYYHFMLKATTHLVYTTSSYGRNCSVCCCRCCHYSTIRWLHLILYRLTRAMLTVNNDTHDASSGYFKFWQGSANGQSRIRVVVGAGGARHKGDTSNDVNSGVFAFSHQHVHCLGIHGWRSFLDYCWLNDY